MWHDSLDSTNSEIRRRSASLDNLSTIAALRQTAGRGRGSHTWHSADGENLTFSILLKFSAPDSLPGPDRLPPLLARDQELITDISTLAVLSFLKSEGVTGRIKWPNDVWIGDRKICGILVENVLRGNYLDYSIVGIGLNLNQTEFSPDLPNPVSLKLVTGKSYDLKETLERFLAVYCDYTEMSSTQQGRSFLAGEFRNNVFVLDKDRQADLDEAIERFENFIASGLKP